jgi:hypothetical protein
MASFTDNDTGYDSGYDSDESLYNTYHNYEDAKSATRADLLIAVQTLEEGNETDEEELSPIQKKIHDNLNYSMYSKSQLIFSVLGQTAMISHGQLWVQASYPREDNESRQKTTYRLLQFLLTGGTLYMQAGGSKWGHTLLVYNEDEEVSNEEEEDGSDEEEEDSDEEDENEDDSEEEYSEEEFSSPIEEYIRIFHEVSEERPDVSKNTIHASTLHTMESLDIDTSNFQTRQDAVLAFAELLGIYEPPITDALHIVE